MISLNFSSSSFIGHIFSKSSIYYAISISVDSSFANECICPPRVFLTRSSFLTPWDYYSSYYFLSLSIRLFITFDNSYSRISPRIWIKCSWSWDSSIVSPSQSVRSGEYPDVSMRTLWI